MTDTDTTESTLIERDPKPETRPRGRPAAIKKSHKPTHYKTVCISMYTADVDGLDAKVAELRRRGLSRMSKSQLIRIALEQLDLDRVETITRGVR